MNFKEDIVIMFILIASIVGLVCIIIACEPAVIKPEIKETPSSISIIRIHKIRAQDGRLIICATTWNNNAITCDWESGRK